MDLLGRDFYLDQLSGLLRLATTGTGHTVLISGEAGIGKTALVEQFVSQHSNDATRLWGACEALFTPRPLGPLYDLATQARGSLSTLMSRNTERPILFAALLDEIQQSPLPTIVVFEDVHWADEATLDLIKFLGRRISHLPALFLVTYRDTELGHDHPLWSVIGDLPANAATRLKLTPLTEEAVTSMAQLAHRSAEQLYAITGGNPFFVTEVLASDSPGVPLVVRDAVFARIARLSSDARSLLELVSVVPSSTERWLLDSILDSPEEALEACLTNGMLSLDHATVAFRHELARQAVENTLPSFRRRAQHAQVLQALMNHGDDASQAARLVHHALGAHDKAMVARYAPLAAMQASAQGAHREAAAQYATALLSANLFPPERQAELLAGRAYECYLISQIEEAIQARQQALQIWRELKRSDQVGQTLRWLSRLSWFLGKSNDAEQYAAEAVQLLETLPAGSELAMAYSNLAQLALFAENTAEVVLWGERAITLAESLGDTETLVHALNNVGTALLAAQDERGRSLLERSLQLALEHRLEEHVARAYTNLACLAIRSHNYQLAEGPLQEGRAYCAEHNLDSWGTYLDTWQAYIKFEQGSWDAAAEEARGVLNHFRLSTVVKITSLVVLGWIGVRRGDPDSERILDEARTLALATGELQRIAPVAAARAEAAWLRGNQEQCLAETHMAYNLALTHPDPWRLGELCLWMWHAGSLTSPPRPIAEPFARQIAGDWQAAANLWKHLGCPYEQARALADGDAEAMRNALALFERLGAQPAATLVRRRLRQLGVRGIPRRPHLSTRTNLAGLTSRQMEVLELLAEGLPNAEIASRLFTSLKTVDRHVSAVLTKLGVHSRAQAISVAFQMELLPPKVKPKA